MAKQETGPRVEYQLPGVFCHNPVIRCKAGRCERPPLKRIVREWKANVTHMSSAKKRKTDAAIAQSQGWTEGSVGFPGELRVRDRVSESSGTEESWESGRSAMGESRRRCDSSPCLPDSRRRSESSPSRPDSKISLVTTAHNTAAPSLSSLATAQDTDSALSLKTASQLHISIPKLKIPPTTTSQHNTATLPTLTDATSSTASPLTFPQTTAGLSLSALAAAHLHSTETSISVAPLVINPLGVPTLEPHTSHPIEDTSEELSVMECLEGDIDATIDLQMALVTLEQREKSKEQTTDSGDFPHAPPPDIEQPQQTPQYLAMLKRSPSAFGEVIAGLPYASGHRSGYRSGCGSLPEQRNPEGTIRVPFAIFAFDTPSPDEEVLQAMNDPSNPLRYKLIMQERQSRVIR